MSNSPVTVLHADPSPWHVLHLSSRAVEPSIKLQPTGYMWIVKEHCMSALRAWKVINHWCKWNVVEHTYLTCTINANINWMIITSCTVNDFWLVTIIEAFASWHAIQFTWIWCFCVWHPIVIHTLEWCSIKVRALLLSKVWFVIRTILCIARKIFLITALTLWIAARIQYEAFALLKCNSTAACSWTFRRIAPWTPFLCVAFTVWYYEALGQVKIGTMLSFVPVKMRLWNSFSVLMQLVWCVIFMQNISFKSFLKQLRNVPRNSNVWAATIALDVVQNNNVILNWEFVSEIVWFENLRH